MENRYWMITYISSTGYTTTYTNIYYESSPVFNLKLFKKHIEKEDIAIISMREADELEYLENKINV